MRRLLTAAACGAVALSGCWASSTHVEPVRDEHVRFDIGPPQPHLQRTEVSFREEPQGLSLVLHRQQMCAVREVRRSQDEVHTKVEASSRRWVPAAVLGGIAAAQVVDYQRSEDEDRHGGSLLLGTAVLVGTAAAFVAIPTLAEREHTRVGGVHERTVSAPERPCGQAAVAGGEVAVRTPRGTREGTTAGDGTVRFEGMRKADVQTVFLGGVAVWLSDAPVDPAP